MQITNIAQLKRECKRISNHFFDKNTMSFFNSIVESGLLKNNTFITSERCHEDDKKLFTIRKITQHDNSEDIDIKTVSEFQEYKTLDTALRQAKLMTTILQKTDH